MKIIKINRYDKSITTLEGDPTPFAGAKIKVRVSLNG